MKAKIENSCDIYNKMHEYFMIFVHFVMILGLEGPKKAILCDKQRSLTDLLA